MRQALRFLRNRYSVALALIVVIAVAVGFGKLAGGRSVPQTFRGSTTSIAAGTTSLPPDDGVGSPPSPDAPSTSPGAADPQTVAGEFAQAWLNHLNVTGTQWHAAVARYATPALSQRLDGVDPTGVPASSMVGDIAIVARAASYVDVSIPLDSGTLDLRLVSRNGRWLVDGVDWQRP